MASCRTAPALPSQPRWAWCLPALVIVLLALLMGVVVFGLLYVSAALSALFTWLPAVLVHALLR